MTIKPTETQLTGTWLPRDGRAVADEACERINQLVRSYLDLLGRDVSGWDTLYRDPDDGRLWELTYPQSGRHGGGPPQLRCLTLNEAIAKYGSIVSSDESTVARLRISISSPPDREKLVAEIFFGDVQWAEINQEREVLEVEFYPRPDGEPWRIDYDDMLKALFEAKSRLEAARAVVR